MASSILYGMTDRAQTTMHLLYISYILTWALSIIEYRKVCLTLYSVVRCQKMIKNVV
jgi:hypothetical protein